MSNGGEARDAQAALDIAGRAAASGRTAAGRYVRRYLFGLGIASALWLLALAAIAHWFSLGSLARATLTSATVGLLFALAGFPAAREPVRAQLSSRARIVTVVGGAVVFAVPAALAQDHPGAAVIGALLVVIYWAACAAVFSRAR